MVGGAGDLHLGKAGGHLRVRITKLAFISTFFDQAVYLHHLNFFNNPASVSQADDLSQLEGDKEEFREHPDGKAAAGPG
nr:sodium/potassium-transporting ATPase subunit gamma isoform X2 [Manis javanica]